MPTIHELDNQVQWELEGVRRAVESYREAAAAADPATLAPGKALMRGVVKPLIAAIEAKREEAADLLARGVRTQAWAWPIQVLDPTKAAVITLNVACRCSLGQVARAKSFDAISFTGATEELGAMLRDQLDFDRWAAAEEARNAEARQTRAPNHQDRLKALKLRYPDLDQRVWRKWRRKLEIASAAEWSPRDDVVIGAMFLKLLTEVAPDKFAVAKRPRHGGVQYYLELTEATKAVLRDVSERAEVARPRLMPMLAPPLPWTYPKETPNAA